MAKKKKETKNTGTNAEKALFLQLQIVKATADLAIKKVTELEKTITELQKKIADGQKQKPVRF